MSEFEESFADPDITIQRTSEDEGTKSGSVYSVSQTSEVWSSTRETSSSRGRTRKRRDRDPSTSSYSRVKRLKGFYNDGYRKLFNNTVEEIVSQEILLDPELTSSQIGVSLWSSEEKELLFSSLARKGRHDIQTIASDVGSKSESEITVFLQKVQGAANEEQIYELATKRLLKAHQIDAAVEIGEDCCTSLDQAAEVLSVLQQREEEKLERKNYDDFSILTGRNAKWVDHRLRTGELGEGEVAKAAPAAVLLNLKTCLSLSKRIFMNSSDMENNWRSYVERSKAPSIVYTAFSDFHNLLLSITKRLVQSSLFFAMSRLRAIDVPGQNRPSQHVKRIDVEAALDALSMPRNSVELWAGTARKCKLRVYENVRRRQVSGKRYSYDEIENVLNSKQRRSRGRSSSGMAEEANVLVSGRPDSKESSSTEEDETSNSSTPSSTEDNHSRTSSSNEDAPMSSSDEKPDKQELLEKAQDFYAEAIDQRASRAEERRLWKLLGEDPVLKMTDANTQLPNIPASERKDMDDLVDWPSRIDYMPEWEKFDTPVPASSFVENRRHGRNVIREVESADSESESESEDPEQSSESEAEELERSSREIPTRRRSRSNAVDRGNASSKSPNTEIEESAGSDGSDDQSEYSAPSAESGGAYGQDEADGVMEESSDEDVAAI